MAHRLMMTLHKLHAGDGYTYLTRQVAAGDDRRTAGQALVDYYTATGNPFGQWAGSGAADLAIDGQVTESQMRALFGKGMHPDAEQIVALERAGGATDAEALKAAKLGAAFPDYAKLEPREVRVAARAADFESHRGRPPSEGERVQIEKVEARRERRAVAGYDLVFTPVKSASLLWALGDAATRQAVEDAHHEAVANTLSWLERETAFARTGHNGTAQVDTRGFIAACFDHRDSRAGDPDLHTHVAIANKVRAVADRPDGSPHWLSLDARVLHAAAVAASERYNTRIEDALTRRLGVQFIERSDSVRTDKRAIREIAGIPDALVRHFSRRRAAIEDRYCDLASEYRHAHGHEPSNAAQLKLAQQATLQTRDAKGPGVPLADKITAWRSEAARVIGGRRLRRLVADCTGQPPAVSDTSAEVVDTLAAAAVAVVAEHKATWTRWTLLAEIERQLRPLRFTTPDEREALTARVFARTLDPDTSVHLVATESDGPVVERRVDGQSVFTQHGAGRFTTQATLDAEQRLLDAAAQPTRYALDPSAVEPMLQAYQHRHDVELDPGQHALVTAFASDPRRLLVGVGPAGAGKTTAMHALARVWQAAGRRIVPLAPSASAAGVLSEELGCRAENLHKFQHTHQSGTADADPWFKLQPGDLVLVDEAGMAATKRLDWLVSYARERGALVRLLGDPYQLSAVEAGGAFGLLVHDIRATELDRLHRFVDPAEARATLAIRSGNARGLDFYLQHDRVVSGSADAMLEAAYNAWSADTRAGLVSLLIAGSNDDVTVLTPAPDTNASTAAKSTLRGSSCATATWPASATGSSPGRTTGPSAPSTARTSSETVTYGPSNTATETAT